MFTIPGDSETDNAVDESTTKASIELAPAQVEAPRYPALFSSSSSFVTAPLASPNSIMVFGS